MVTLTRPAPDSPVTSSCAISSLHFLHFVLHLLGLLHQVTQPPFPPNIGFSLSKSSLRMLTASQTLQSNGANTFIQIRIEEPAQRLNVVIRNNRFARLRELLFINCLPPLQRRAHRRIIVFHDGQLTGEPYNTPSASANSLLRAGGIKMPLARADADRYGYRPALPRIQRHLLYQLRHRQLINLAAQPSRSTASSASFAASLAFFHAPALSSAPSASRPLLSPFRPSSSLSSDRLLFGRNLFPAPQRRPGELLHALGY